MATAGPAVGGATGPGRRVGSKEDMHVRIRRRRSRPASCCRRHPSSGSPTSWLPAAVVGFERALEVGAVATIETIAAAGLRGRGGAGFPTGRKWQSVRDAGAGQRFVVVNAAEGEPATFKDRTLMRRDPYRIVEGAAIAAFAVGADAIYLATKRSFGREVERCAAPPSSSASSACCRSSASTSSRGPTTTSTARRRRCSRSSRVATRCRDCCRRTSSASSRPTRRSAGRPDRGPWRGTPCRTRPSSTTPRRSPLRRTSWPTAPSGSGRWAPPSLRAR